jgi:hypothetical protein
MTGKSSHLDKNMPSCIEKKTIADNIIINTKTVNIELD